MYDWMPVVSSLLVLATVVLSLQSLGSVWDSLTRKYISDLLPSLDALSISRKRVPFFLRLWGLAILAVVVVMGIILGMPPLAFGTAYLVYVAPRLILQMLIARRKEKLRDQMVGATTALANACRAGLSLAQALEAVAVETPAPLSVEIKQIVTEYQHGRPLPDAIAATKDRLDLDSFTLFATALLIAIERGGKITESLERISHSLQETQRLERKLAAETASGKNVVKLLTIFPLFFLAFLFLTKPTETMMVFQSFFGQCIMLLVMVLIYGSVRWSNKILNIEM